jgi:hypothetical protein
VTVRLRAGGLPLDDTTMVVHMGAGDRSRLLATTIDTYDEYRQLRDDGYGYFALSVFAAHAGYTVEAICDALPWRSYGTCRADRLREHFSLLATTILAPDGTPAGELQAVHYDVVLPHPDDERLLVPGALAHDENGGTRLLAAVESFLAPSVETFASLFEPRLDKRGR